MKQLPLLIVFLFPPLTSSGEQQELIALNAAGAHALQCEQHDEDPWLGTDKFLHVAASASITWVSYHAYHYHYDNPVDRSIYFSFSVAAASGIGKELYDVKLRKAGWSWKDIVADGVGIAIGYLLCMQFN